MDATLMEFDASNAAMATELVEKIGRVIDLAQACAGHDAANNEIIADGRAALIEVADFFEVDPPGASS